MFSGSGIAVEAGGGAVSGCGVAKCVSGTASRLASCEASSAGEAGFNSATKLGSTMISPKGFEATYKAGATAGRATIGSGAAV